jgi:hypothetical protein
MSANSVSPPPQRQCGIEHRQARRLRQIARIGVPNAAEVRFVFGFFDDRHHVRVVGKRLCERIYLALAQPRRKRAQGGWIELLVAQRQHVILE